MIIKNNETLTTATNLLDVSENIARNTQTVNKIKQRKSAPLYLSQFETQTYDNNGDPSAQNSLYETDNISQLTAMERNFAYNEGWSKYNDESMSYKIIADKDFTHNNMVPFFKPKNGYGLNSMHNNNVMDFKNELFTGVATDTYKNKRETKSLFAPSSDMSYIYGTPTRDSSEDSRYIPSLYRQNETLFDPIRDTPGLNLQYNEIGKQGYQDNYRVTPKTVDQLRTLNNQKTTYEGRIIEGQKGVERPIQAPVVSYRPDTFKILDKKDLIKTSDANKGPKTRDNFIMRDTDRENTSTEYTGGAYTSGMNVGKNVPENMREKHKNTTRQTFKLPKPLQKFAKDQIMYNQNQQSFDLKKTNRVETGNNTYVSNNGKNNLTYTPNSDNAKPTLRQITSTTPQNYTNIRENTLRGTVPIMDIAKTTVRETIDRQSLNPNAPTLNTKQKIYLNDTAKQTTREITSNIQLPSYVKNTDSIYMSLSDIPNTTMRETLSNIPRQTVVSDNIGILVSNNDIAKNTTRESTVQIPNNLFLQGSNKFNTLLQDNAKNTTKETIVDIPYPTFVSNQNKMATNISDIVRSTTRETTLQIPRQSTISNSQGILANYNDNAKNTIKETTVDIPTQTIITNAHGIRTDNNDFAKSTLKETTVEKPVKTFTTLGKGILTTNNEIAKNTMRETTVEIPYSTYISNNKGVRTDNNDSARNTIKETTVDIPYSTFIANKKGIQAKNDDVTRNTMRETLIENNYIGNATHDVNTKGFGYLSEKPLIQNTNRQFTEQQVYVTPAEGITRNRSRRDALNAEQDNRKELLIQHRKPTPCNYDKGPDLQQLNVAQKNDDNTFEHLNPIDGTTTNDRLKSYQTIKMPNSNIPLYNIDPVVLDQLKNNPYNIKLF